MFVLTLRKFQTFVKLKIDILYLHLTFILSSFILRSLFVLCLSARAARTVFCSSFVRLLFVHCSSFVRSLFVFCSFIVRLLLVNCSSFVRSLFVFCSLIIYPPVRLAPSCCATTSYLPFCHLLLLWYSFRYIPPSK